MAGVWAHIQTHRGLVAPSPAGPRRRSQEALWAGFLPAARSLGLGLGDTGPGSRASSPGALLLLLLTRGWQSLSARGRLAHPCPPLLLQTPEAATATAESLWDPKQGPLRPNVPQERGLTFVCHPENGGQNTTVWFPASPGNLFKLQTSRAPPQTWVFQPALQGDCDAGQLAEATALHQMRGQGRKARNQHPGVVWQPEGRGLGPHIIWAPGDPAVGLPTVRAGRSPKGARVGWGRLRPKVGGLQHSLGLVFPALNCSCWVPGGSQLLARAWLSPPASESTGLLGMEPAWGAVHNGSRGIPASPHPTHTPPGPGARALDPPQQGSASGQRSRNSMSPSCGRETLAPREHRVNPEPWPRGK